MRSKYEKKKKKKVLELQELRMRRDLQPWWASGKIHALLSFPLLSRVSVLRLLR